MNPYCKLHSKFHTHLGNQIITNNHRGRRVEKAYKALHKLSNTWIHIGELCLAMIFMTSSYMLWGWESLPNNTSLVYPLYKISTLECRSQAFSSMPESCKIALPLIHSADYTTYQNDSNYTDIYTTLRAGSYSSPRDQTAGAHDAVDIATAKWTPLYAIADGEVYAAETNSAYGNVVKIKFKYKGEILFAVYAHMDKYIVKTWDKITKGQKIWEVWNSGNTFGELGGFHVHFEIDKNANGKPAYAYTACPDISKWHTEIISKGLCRVQLFQYTKDPILLLENANAVYPVSSLNTPQNTNPQPENKPENKPDNTTGTTTTPETPTNPVLPADDNKIPLSIDFSKLDIVGKQFLDKRDISITKTFSNQVNLQDSYTITLNITNKKTWEPFHGTLTQPILFITNNTNISLNPVSTILVNHWTATITLTPKIKGSTYIMINLWTVKIAGFTLNILES